MFFPFSLVQPSVIEEEVSEGFYRLIALLAITILQQIQNTNIKTQNERYKMRNTKYKHQEVSECFYRLMAVLAKTVLQHSPENFKETTF